MLHPDFLARPVAHRGLHGAGVPENSMAAFRAAVERGHAIELDVQPARDSTPLVFHDDDLPRLTGKEGLISQVTLAEAKSLRLSGTDQTIPTLTEVLEMVAGRVPVLVEIKDQDGRLGPDMGDLPRSVARIVSSYKAPIAVMSFNPDAVALFRISAPATTVGLTTCAFDADDWPEVAESKRRSLGRIEDFDRVGASFISHDHLDLTNSAVTALASRGVPVLCWTIRSVEAERAARRVAKNITYEGYTPCEP